jgi:hypothetical protein
MYRKTPAKFGLMAQTANLTLPMADKRKGPSTGRASPDRCSRFGAGLLLIVLLVAGP